MFKYRLAILSLLLVKFNAFCQERQTFTKEQLVTCCVKLISSKGSGSGIFMLDNQNLYIVTASHVAIDMDALSFIIIDGTNHIPSKIKLADISKTISSGLPWNLHKSADIAILKLSLTKNTEALKTYGLPLMYFNSKLTAPGRDQELTTFGFAFGLGDNPKFSPLTMKSSPASDLINISNPTDPPIITTYFFLEGPSIQGYSGGPVFDLGYQSLGGGAATAYNGQGTICYGILTSTLSDNTGGKLGGVIPSYYLYELLGKNK